MAAVRESDACGRGACGGGACGGSTLSTLVRCNLPPPKVGGAGIPPLSAPPPAVLSGTMAPLLSQTARLLGRPLLSKAAAAAAVRPGLAELSTSSLAAKIKVGLGLCEGAASRAPGVTARQGRHW